MKLHSSISGDYHLTNSVPLQPSITSKPNLKKDNYVEFNKLIEDAHNMHKFSNSNVNLSYSSLIDEYRLAMTKCVPMMKSSSKHSPNPKWFNAEVKKATVTNFFASKELFQIIN